MTILRVFQNPNQSVRSTQTAKTPISAATLAARTHVQTRTIHARDQQNVWLATTVPSASADKAKLAIPSAIASRQRIQFNRDVRATTTAPWTRPAYRVSARRFVWEFAELTLNATHHITEPVSFEIWVMGEDDF
jgi:hypothetical protein